MLIAHPRFPLMGGQGGGAPLRFWTKNEGGGRGRPPIFLARFYKEEYWVGKHSGVFSTFLSPKLFAKWSRIIPLGKKASDFQKKISHEA